MNVYFFCKKYLTSKMGIKRWINKDGIVQNESWTWLEEVNEMNGFFFFFLIFEIVDVWSLYCLSVACEL